MGKHTSYEAAGILWLVLHRQVLLDDAPVAANRFRGAVWTDGQRAAGIRYMVPSADQCPYHLPEAHVPRRCGSPVRDPLTDDSLYRGPSG